MLCGSRIYHHHQLGLGFRYYSRFSSFPKSSFLAIPDRRLSTSPSPAIDIGLPAAANCVRPTSAAAGIPILSNCFSQHENDHDPPTEESPSTAGGVVALGKFDALHIGHRQLAVHAAKVGVPFLLSFVGMAEVLGWEPRAPIVAKCDRKRVLSSWAPYCNNMTPTEVQLDFAKVRHLSPLQFVEKLSNDLRVCGVVAGENYRFGYKAAGDSSELVRLCKEQGMGAYIINSVMDSNQDSSNMGSSNPKEQGQVSSTRVRHALAEGDMKYVSELLGRPHRLILSLEDREMVSIGKNTMSAPKSCLANLPPKDGVYEKCSVCIGEKEVAVCRVIIDSAIIHLELGDVTSFIHNSSHGFQFLAIDFGDSVAQDI